MVELKKLYEGTPASVIRHFHKYAVSKAEAEKDLKQHGSRNIGQRAKDVIYAYLRLTAALTDLANQLKLFLEQEDIGSFSRKMIDYHGWWNIPELKSLSYVSSSAMAFPEFLDRSMELFKLLEYLKPSPLKQILGQLGMPREDFRTLGSLRLIGTLGQLAAVAEQHGNHLIRDFDYIYTQWDKQASIEQASPLFALNGLRNLKGHITGKDYQERLEVALENLNIDKEDTRNGWGYALDVIYDELTQSLNNTAQLICDSYQ